MMNEHQFILYCERLKLAEPSRKYIERVRCSPPSRKVQSGGGNVTSRFPSRKMGVVIQSESHRHELSVIYLMEDDPDVLEFYEQPESIPLSYKAASGRAITTPSTPDFLVLRSDAVQWIEVKPGERLEELAISQPNRYCKDEKGDWRCPPGEAVAADYGFQFVLWNSARTNSTMVRNLRYLDDYTRLRPGRLSSHETERFFETIKSCPGITLEELQLKFGQESIDSILAMIAKKGVYVDLCQHALYEGSPVPVFPDKATADALSSIKNALVCDPGVGAVENNGQEQSGQLQPVNQKALDLITSTSENDLETASLRTRLLRDPEAAARFPERTLRRWRSDLRQAEEIYGKGYGYLGLIPKVAERGNRVPRLPQIVYDLAETTIREHFLSPTRPPVSYAYGIFMNACDKNGVRAPTRKWFQSEINAIRKEELTERREGRRAAYKYRVKIGNLEDNGTHGDYPWQIVHVDHTEIDVELIDEETGENLGRAWLSLMFDAFSRRVLAFYLTFDPPGTRSVMMLLRDCVRRFNRLPSNLVIDGGKEFGSKAFETFTANHEIIVHKRPPAQARFGSVIERYFGTANKQFFHLLAGNTQNTKNVRQLTKSVNPKNLAVWSLERVTELLTNFCFGHYDRTAHPALQMSPGEKYEKGMLAAGPREGRAIPYDETFRFITMSSTPKGTAKIQPGLGVKVFYVYYWNEAMRDPQREGTEVPVRYDPEDLSTVYARIGKEWVRCFSSFHARLQGRSVKQLKIACEEIKRNRSKLEKDRPIAAKELAAFLESARGEESLRAQRRKDLALQRALDSAGTENSAAKALPVVVTPPIEIVPQLYLPEPPTAEVFGDF